VLAIGETVEEVNDSGFLGSTPTIRTQLMADDSMLQVCCNVPLLHRGCVVECLPPQQQLRSHFQCCAWSKGVSWLHSRRWVRPRAIFRIDIVSNCSILLVRRCTARGCGISRRTGG